MTLTCRPLLTGLVLALAAGCTFDTFGLGDDAGASDGSSSSSTATTTTDPGETTTTGATTAGTTTTGATTSPGFCGDGMIGGDEVCDNGEANGAGSSCKEDCTPHVCGDGIVGPQEGCDDGNTVGGDGCSATCTSEACGNGVVEGLEECDDGNQDDTDTCTSLCKNAACSDGFVQPGEECDNGAENGPGKACKADCTANVCGDGDVGPGEACDDGNSVNEDTCTNACAPAACGDGFVQPGEACDAGGESATCDADCTAVTCGDMVINASAGEECEDGNNNNNDACVACKHAKCGDGSRQIGVEFCDDGDTNNDNQCTNACVLHADARLAFVTSLEYNGNLGGVSGADKHCADRASAASLSGSWMAWIADGADASAPATRFSFKAPKGYARTDGTKIADDWADLTDGSLDAPLSRTESGNIANNNEDEAWTNVAASGARKGNSHCNNWSSNNSNQSGHRGRWTQTNGQWTDANTGGCDRTKRLFCFQQ